MLNQVQHDAGVFGSFAASGLKGHQHNGYDADNDEQEREGDGEDFEGCHGCFFKGQPAINAGKRLDARPRESACLVVFHSEICKPTKNIIYF